MRSVRRINIASPEFKYDSEDPPGFRAGMFRFGKLVGASDLGASVYESPPGQPICPYHYEYGEEERLLVLEGDPPSDIRTAPISSSRGTPSAFYRAGRRTCPCATRPMRPFAS